MQLLKRNTQRMAAMLSLFDRKESWLIVINADPDALASAMALKRIMARRTAEVVIASCNAVTRPDNLAMLRYLRIPLVALESARTREFSRYAMVDSQPHHNPAFGGIPFSVIIDHHPLLPQHVHKADYKDIRPGLATTSAIMTEYLFSLRIRPGSRLATGLQYGIRADTASFSRNTNTIDLQAYQYLARYADTALLNRIMRSEYLPEWLKFFSRAFQSMHQIKGGCFAFAGEVESPDILVLVADFFTRVHGFKWVAVGGIYKETGVVIFRGDGQSLDLGRFAAASFGDIGSAGGHKTMARAEFALSVTEGRNVEAFIYKRIIN